jgi:hypothetical protein
MGSLKRNSKGEVVYATGLRVKQSSFYKPNQPELFKISRSKLNDFLSCPKCFYLDRVVGLVSPSMPGWTLNTLVDTLLKKEFDECRELQIPHRIFEKYGLSHLVPFKHPELNHWRNALTGGVETHIPNTNIILHGGVDDIWQDTTNGNLIVLDYKSQSNNYPITPESYLSGIYHQAYKMQLDVYGYLLEKNGFPVAPIGYFYVCNAKSEVAGFSGIMEFEEILIPYTLDYSWVEPQIFNMLNTLNSKTIPEETFGCENCAYHREREKAGDS